MEYIWPVGSQHSTLMWMLDNWCLSHPQLLTTCPTAPCSVLPFCFCVPYQFCILQVLLLCFGECCQPLFVWLQFLGRIPWLSDLPNNISTLTHVSPKYLALVAVILFVRADADAWKMPLRMALECWCSRTLPAQICLCLIEYPPPHASNSSFGYFFSKTFCVHFLLP